MKLNDFMLKKVPLTLNGEEVEDTFIKQLPVKDLTDFQKLNNNSEGSDKIKEIDNLIRKSLVNGKGQCAIKKDDQYSSEFMELILNQILEVNIPSGKQVEKE